MTYYISKKKRKERSIIIPIDENKKNWNIKHLQLPFLLQGWQWYPSEGEES